MQGEGPARADARANRARIVAAAREVFAERGVEADMREICARAEVGMGTLYRNFPAKEDLVAAIVGEIVGEVLAAVERAAAEADPRESVLVLMREFWQVVERHRQLAHALHESAHRVELPEMALVRERADRVIARARAAGAIGPDIPLAFLGDYLEQQMDCYLALRERWDAETVQALCERILAGGIVCRDAGSKT